MELIQKKLSDLSEKIENSKKKIATYEGREHELTRSIKETLNVKNIEEAEEEIGVLEGEQKKLEKEINKLFDKLSEEYDW